MVKFEINHYEEFNRTSFRKVHFINIIIKEYSQAFYNYAVKFSSIDDIFSGFNSFIHNYGEPMNIHKFDEDPKNIATWLDQIKAINL